MFHFNGRYSKSCGFPSFLFFFMSRKEKKKKEKTKSQRLNNSCEEIIYFGYATLKTMKTIYTIIWSELLYMLVSIKV